MGLIASISERSANLDDAAIHDLTPIARAGVQKEERGEIEAPVALVELNVRMNTSHSRTNLIDCATRARCLRQAMKLLNERFVRRKESAAMFSHQSERLEGEHSNCFRSPIVPNFKRSLSSPKTE